MDPDPKHEDCRSISRSEQGSVYTAYSPTARERKTEIERQTEIKRVVVRVYLNSVKGIDETGDTDKYPRHEGYPCNDVPVLCDSKSI